MDSNSKIFVAGHKGLVGSAIVRHLEAEGFTNIITADRRQVESLLGNATKAKEKLGWEPKTTFKQLVEDMCIYGQ